MAPVELKPSEVERFKGKIGAPTVDGCRLWTGEVNNKGYGRFTVYRGDDRRRLLTHRLAFELETGVDPGAAKLLHSCDTPPCCEPSHLRLGTQADNMREAADKGRVNTAGLTAYREAREAAARARRFASEKPCSRCHVIKSMDSFNKVQRSIDGRAGQCRVCAAEYRRERKERQRELLVEADLFGDSLDGQAA
jgi:hypothetical protein